MARTKAIRGRRKARITALQALYEIDASSHSLETICERLIENSKLSEGSAEYMMRLVDGVAEKGDELDIVIRKYAPAWPVEDLANIDRNILRLAIYEIVFGGETPPKVSVNEAVELAKLFGADGSARFVNGVLGSVLGDMSRQPQEKDSKYVQ